MVHASPLQGTSRLWWAASLSALLTLSAGVARAAPPGPEACVAAHARAQIERKAGRLRSARDELFTCADDGCPRLVRSDCDRWLDEVRDSVPKLVVVARGPLDDDIRGVRITVDGTELATPLDGAPFEVDPGEHAVVCRAPNGTSVSVAALVAAGERTRTVVCRFDRAEPATPVVTVPRPTPGDRPATRASRSPWVVWGLGGVALAAAGAATFFYTAGVRRDGELRDTCAPRCDDGAVSRVSDMLVAGDVSALIALAAGGAAVLLALAHPTPGRTTVFLPRLGGSF